MEKFFISRPIFAISLAIVIVLVGLISILNLPIEQYPDITPPVVEVSATYDGADAETVNNAVATPVAQSVMGVSDMLYLQTTSANDGSMVMQVTFDIGSDPDLDAIFTQNNVSSAAAQLPATVTKQGVTTRKTMTGFLLVFSLHSDGRYDDEFLSNYAYINLQNELLKINGVGKVSIMGAGEYARMAPARRAEILRHPGFGRHRRHRKSGRHLPCRTVRSRTSARRHLLYLYGDHAPADHHGRAVRRHRRRDHL